MRKKENPIEKILEALEELERVLNEQETAYKAAIRKARKGLKQVKRRRLYLKEARKELRKALKVRSLKWKENHLTSALKYLKLAR